MVTSRSPVGVHFNVWTPAWDETGSRRAIEATKEAGFDFVEITIFDLATFDAKATARMLKDVGLAATCSTALVSETDISSGDEDAARRGEQHLLECLERATTVGSKWLVGATYGAWGKHQQGVTPEGRASSVEILRRVADRAANLGITIGLEVLNRYETNALNTTQQARELIDEIGSPNIQIQLDTYHANIEEKGQAEAVYACGDRLGYLHIGENHRGMLGTGTIDFRALFRAALDVGFTGPVAFEAFSLNAVGTQHGAVLSVWRDLWDDSLSMAEHARRFIEEQLAAARAVRDSSVSHVSAQPA